MMEFGVSVWPQYTRWDDMKKFGLVVERIREYTQAGVQALYLRGCPPYDEESWTRLMTEVKPQLRA